MDSYRWNYESLTQNRDPMSPHRLEKQVTRAAQKAARKSRRPLTEQEALDLKIQIVPTWLRWVLGCASMVGAIASTQDWFGLSAAPSAIVFIFSLFVLAFAIFGIRKTLSALGEVISSQMLPDLLGAAVETSASIFQAVTND